MEDIKLTNNDYLVIKKGMKHLVELMEFNKEFIDAEDLEDYLNDLGRYKQIVNKLQD